LCACGRRCELLGSERRVRLVDVLSGGAGRFVLAVVLAAALSAGGCGGDGTRSQPTLPAARPVPPPRPLRVPPQATPTTRAAEAESEADLARRRWSAGGPIPAGRMGSFAALQAQLGGQIGVALSGIGFGQPVQTLGPLQSTVAWSTSKVPV